MRHRRGQARRVPRKRCQLYVLISYNLLILLADTRAAQTVTKAYEMCAGQTNAISPTHSTIVATLLVPQGSGPIQIATPTTMAMSTAAPTASDTRVTSTSLPTSTTMTAGSSTSAPAAVSTATSIPSSVPDSSGGTQTNGKGLKLSVGQIIGVSLGATGVVALAIAMFCVVRAVRRKQRAEASPPFSQMRDSWGWKPSPNMPNISAPIFKQLHELPYQRSPVQPAIQPSTIGLAISPKRTTAPTLTAVPGAYPSVQQPSFGDRTGQQAPRPPYSTPQMSGADGPSTINHDRQAAYTAAVPAQRLADSPPKPSLTLNIPSNAERASGPRTVTSRESVVTEFAEDGDPDSAVIWRPPTSIPSSTNTYYVADRWGNWVLGNAHASTNSEPQELEAPSQLTKTRAEKAQAVPPVPQAPFPYTRNEVPVPPARSTLRQVPAGQGNPDYPLQRSSSIYSNYSLPRSVVPDAQNPMPSIPNVGYLGIDATQAKKKSKAVDRSQSITSSIHSSTTIDSSHAEDEGPLGPDGAATGLSPVAESPSSPQSPVRYPQIPGRGQGSPAPVPAPLRLFPRPNIQRSPPGQPSPTLGVMVPISSRPGLGPSRLGNAPPMTLGLPSRPSPAYARDPAQVRTGSPEMRGQSQQTPAQAKAQMAVASKAMRAQQFGLPRSPSPHVRLQEAAAQGPRQASPRFDAPSQAQWQQRRSPQPQTQQKPPLHELQIRDQQRSSPRPQRPQGSTQAQYEQRGSPRPQQPHAEVQAQYEQRRSPRPQQGQSQLALGSPAQIRPHVGTLMKTMSPPPQVAPTSNTTGGSSLLAKRLGKERAALLAFGDEASLTKPGGGKWARQEDTSGLPATPGWQPKLTPTRKGDDLFLNVQ
jgi:hypothetical protein